jgi:hypothetical protein
MCWSRGERIRAAIIGVAIGMGVLAGGAHAAAPAWKLLAATGPTNVPPTQSEIQRVTVEAEGGTFDLALSAKGEGVFGERSGEVEITEGSNVAKVTALFGEPFTVGEQVSVEITPFFAPGTKIVAISGSAAEPVLELSNPALATEPAVFFLSTTNVVTEVSTSSGEFHVGDEISTSFGAVPPGTTVTAMSPGTLTLSEYPIFGGQQEIEGTEKTTPVAFDAEAGAVQSALEALPAFGAGSVSVTGGPGGVTEHPFFIAFGGAYTDRDVPALTIDGSNLTGANPAGHVLTVVPGGAGTGEIEIMPANVGSMPTNGRVEVTLGPLPTGVVTAGPAKPTDEGWICPGGGGESTVTCESEKPTPALDAGYGVAVPIEVGPGAPSHSTVPVAISGGGAGSATYQMPLTISGQRAAFGPQAFWAGAFDENGNLDEQAGAHASSAAAYFLLTTVRSASGSIVPAGDPKDVSVDLPPGFIGNPMVTPRCPQSQLARSSQLGSPACNPTMKIGEFNPALNGFGQIDPIFNVSVENDVPANGYAAEFTTQIASPEVSLFASVRGSEDYGVRITALNTPTYGKVFGAFTALEGNPPGAAGKAFLTNPADCAEEAVHAPVATLFADSWEQQGVLSSVATQALPTVHGCDKLEFTPSLTFEPSTTQGSSGTGATAHLHLPQANLLDPSKLAQPPLKKAVVTLPPGLTLNPSSAKGLEACSEEQIGYLGTGPLPNPNRFNESAPSCPNGSKLGTVEVFSPLLEETLDGTIYLAEQEKNPFGSLIALYLAIESPRFGLQIKLPGRVDPNPETGRLTATFDNNPQVPFEDLTLHFRGGGPQSVLATPEVCGHYATTGSLEPWSAPESGPAAQIEEPGFTVGNGCAPSADKQPFGPTFEAGTTSTQAGAYSPLVIKVGRKDGEQGLKSLEFTLPKGLVAKAAGIPYCPESAIQEAERKSGKAEKASPSCPAASRIGSVDTAAGVGSEPFHVSGSVYWAGPYEGAPLSSVVITPAVAGPFDLGDVVVRAPLYVDPETAEVTAKSDPIPTILEGIPLKVRSVAIDLDHPTFALNPTSCDPMMVTASIGGSSGATAKPANRFQVGRCKQLKFKPRLQISLTGATKRTGHPALKAVLTYPKQGAYANIARAQVNLPHSEFLDQGNLNKTCTKPVLLEGKCSAKSIYGKAKAWTPLLDKPLEGPVYLVGGYGYKLPALVAELNGQIRVVLKGKVDTGPNKGIRNTFEAVPDAPVSRFVLEMKGGKKYSLLENSENLCKKAQRAIARFTAQNGLVDQSKPLIANQCGKKGKKGGKPKHKKN